MTPVVCFSAGESELYISARLPEHSESSSAHALVVCRRHFPSCIRFALASGWKTPLQGQQSSAMVH